MQQDVLRKPEIAEYKVDFHQPQPGKAGHIFGQGQYNSGRERSRSVELPGLGDTFTEPRLVGKNGASPGNLRSSFTTGIGCNIATPMYFMGPVPKRGWT